MKKRLISVLLVIALLITALPISALAAEKPSYGSIPIYLGYYDVDYMADQILAEIPLAGKSDTDKIKAVYDWIIRNCARSGNADKAYFDPEQVVAAVESTGYGDALDSKFNNGEIVFREDLPSFFGGSYYYDSQYYITQFAYDMMMYRIGNCAHYSALLSVLLGHLGYDCRLIAGEFINMDGSTVEHKWNYVLLNGRYYWLDVRMDHATYARTGNIYHSYFLVSDTNTWAAEHNWDHTYSDLLASNASAVASLYESDAAMAASPVWERCSGWAKDYMKKAYDMGIVPDSIYGTDLSENINRQEFAAVAVKFYEALTGTTAPSSYEYPFTDTYDDDVRTAYSLGIVKGTGDGLFQPYEALTREQATTMLGRVCEKYLTGSVGDGSRLTRGSAASFSDDGNIGDWAKNYVYYFVGQGVVNGIGDGSFAPKYNMTKEQALKIAVEAVGEVDSSDVIDSGTSQSDVSQEVQRLRQEVLDLVNAERISRGLSALELDDAMCKAAQLRAEEITERFSHTRPNGTKCFTALNEAGIYYNSCGENIAEGYSTAADVMAGWMNSDGHRANILGRSFKKIGIGVAITSSGYKYYWTQMFIG